MFGGKKKNILLNGTSARAVITRLEDTGVTVNGNPRVKLILQVQPEGGMPFEANKKVTVSRVAIPTIGSSMWVRYDPEDTSRVEIDEAKNDELSAAATVTAQPAAPAPGGQFAAASFSTTIDGGSTVIDARNNPALRQELMKAVQDVQAGGNPAELQAAVMKAMAEGGAMSMGGAGIPGLSGVPGAGFGTPAPAEDPLDQLEKLNNLRKSGALTDEEFQTQKAKLLGQS